MNDPKRNASEQRLMLNYEHPDLAISRVWRGRAICAVGLLAMFGLIIAGCVLRQSRVRQSMSGTPIEVICPGNLIEIGSACRAYALNSYGNYPDTLAELMRENSLSADLFVCPYTHDVPSPGKSAVEQAANLAKGGHISFIYVGKGLAMSVPNAHAVVLAYEPMSNHGDGSHFLFADGHEEWIRAKEAKALISTIRRIPPPGTTSMDKCAGNLKAIGFVCVYYARGRDGRFPDNFDELVAASDLTGHCFVCPDTNDVPAVRERRDDGFSHFADGHHFSYIYCGKGLNSSVASPDSEVVAYEPLTNHNGAGSNFLFADGHVQWESTADAAALMGAIPATRLAATPRSTTTP